MCNYKLWLILDMLVRQGYGELMASIYPLRFASQMREHLRALRKRQGLTQAELGAQLGVSQARVAEIEANPGLVSFEQLLKLLSHLESGFLLAVGNHEVHSSLDVDLHDTSIKAAEAETHGGEALLYEHADVEEDRDRAMQMREDEEKLVREGADANEARTEREAYSFHKKKGSW